MTQEAKQLLEGTTLSVAIRRFERTVAAHTRAWDEGDLDRFVRDRELDSARADLARQVIQLEAQLAERDQHDEKVRAALFILSDRLRASGALENDAVHIAYELVVGLFDQSKEPK